MFRLAPLLATIAVTTGATASPAQTTDRDPLRGIARIGEQPWPNAEIPLLSRPLPQDDRVGTADVVHMRSDARGRFSARVLPARRYSASALEQLDDGLYRISSIAERVIRASG